MDKAADSGKKGGGGGGGGGNAKGKKGGKAGGGGGKKKGGAPAEDTPVTELRAVSEGWYFSLRVCACGWWWPCSVFGAELGIV